MQQALTLPQSSMHSAPCHMLLMCCCWFVKVPGAKSGPSHVTEKHVGLHSQCRLQNHATWAGQCALCIPSLARCVTPGCDGPTRISAGDACQECKYPASTMRCQHSKTLQCCTCSPQPSAEERISSKEVSSAHVLSPSALISRQQMA